MCFFPRILESLPPLPRQHSAAIGCTKNYQPIGVSVHSHCVESFEGLLQQCRRGRGCSKYEKNTIFPEHPVSQLPMQKNCHLTKMIIDFKYLLCIWLQGLPSRCWAAWLTCRRSCATSTRGPPAPSRPGLSQNWRPNRLNMFQNFHLQFSKYTL